MTSDFKPGAWRDFKPGVYRHYKDGHYYQVLFVAYFDGPTEGLKADQDVFIAYDENPGLGRQPFLTARSDSPEEWRSNGIDWLFYLFTARAHAHYSPGTHVAVYCPLYANKPGRRISVRDVYEFTEEVCSDCGAGKRTDLADLPEPLRRQYENIHLEGAARWIPRFTYVGDTIPEAK